MCTLLVLSFLGGRMYRPADKSDIEAQNTPAVAFAQVERRVVSTGIVLSGVVKAAKRTKIAIPGLSSDDVVVRSPLDKGDSIKPGALLSVINGRPYFALGAPLATYRDLRIGDHGDDVRLLQNRLVDIGYATSRSGTVTSGTVEAARRLFGDYGYELPQEKIPKEPSSDDSEPSATTTRSVIPARQFVSLGSGANLVVSATRVGAYPGENPIVTISRGENFVETSADVTQVDGLSEGDEVDVVIGTETFSGRIVEVGDFSKNDEDGGGGYPIRVEPSDADHGTWPVETAATIRTSESDDESLAVPVIALRSDGAGDFVLKKSSDSETAETRVDVTILRTDAGYAAIDAELEPGDEIRIS